MRTKAQPITLRQSLCQLDLPARARVRTACSVLKGRWAEAAGEALARHTEPVEVEGGVLVVACDPPAWRAPVENLADVLVQRVGQIDPRLRVRAIRVRLVPRRREAVPPSSPRERPLAPEVEALHQAWVSDVADGPRRELLLRLLRAARSADGPRDR